MPPRRRAKTAKIPPAGPVEQFATMLRESAARERAEQERQRIERQEQRDAARRAAEHAAALDTAHRDLERAIVAARHARRTGRGVGDADAEWRRAKARLIELETGAPPSWASTSGGDGDAESVE